MTLPTLAPTPTAESRIADLLDRVARVHPAHSARARSELEVSLAGLRHSVIGALAWESSCLTPSRYPIEVAITSATDELRTVVDVIAPEDDRRTALDRADAIARRFGSPGLSDETAELIRRHQHPLSLRFGAWLGSRHTAGTSTHKLYVEVDSDPARARALVAAIAPDAWRVLGGAGPVRFIGIGLDHRDAIELYARPHFVDGDLLRVLAARAGMPHLADGLAAATVGADDSRAGRNHGVSVATAKGRIVAVAAFTFAHQRLRRDHRVRKSVLTQARAEGWPSAQLYAAASLPLWSAVPLTRPLHTALSEVAIVGSDRIVHQVGMAPPPAQLRRSAAVAASTIPERGERS